MAEYDGPVLVVGATGGVGRRVVQVLQREGIPTRALVRNREKGAFLEKAGVSVVYGDVAAESAAAQVALKEAMEGVRAVISGLGTRQVMSFDKGLREVDYEGTRRLVEAARATGVEHFCLTSTMGVYERQNITKPFSILFYPKWQAEAYLVRSGLPYTIIRPGGLVDDDADLKGPPGWTHRPAFAYGQLDGKGGFGGLGRVHREDVAVALVKSLWTPAARNRIFEVLDRASVKPAGRSKILTDIF